MKCKSVPLERVDYRDESTDLFQFSSTERLLGEEVNHTL